MALGHVLGGGTSINAMVWTRGMQRDYDGWAENGAEGWSFADVLPVFKNQEDWEGGANDLARRRRPNSYSPPKESSSHGACLPRSRPRDGHAHSGRRQRADAPGAGYINMNIAADGTRVSAARAFLRPALSRPNLTLLLNTDVVKLNFKALVAWASKLPQTARSIAYRGR